MIEAIEGLKRLAFNKCCYCDDVEVTPAVLKDGKWIHPAGGFLKGEADCASGEIHDEIAALDTSRGIVNPIRFTHTEWGDSAIGVRTDGPVDEIWFFNVDPEDKMLVPRELAKSDDVMALMGKYHRQWDRMEVSRRRQIKKRLKERKARYEMQGLVLDRLASIDKKLDAALNPHFDA